MKRLSPTAERIVAGLSLCLGFLFMASVFAPDFSHAREEMLPPVPRPVDRAAPPPTSLGTIEDDAFFVEIIATVEGPRYSVIRREDQVEIATMLTAEELTATFPELSVEGMELDSSATRFDADTDAY